MIKETRNLADRFRHSIQRLNKFHIMCTTWQKVPKVHMFKNTNQSHNKYFSIIIP